MMPVPAARVPFPRRLLGMGLLDFFRRRSREPRSQVGRTPEEERSGERDQVRLDSMSAEDITGRARIPGEDEPDRPPRSQ